MKLPNVIKKPNAAAVCPRTHVEQANPYDNDPRSPGRLFVRRGMRAVPCPGEAHRNAHIDNCMRCAPLWGVVAVEDD